MTNIVLYGPISDSVSGGYERMNDNILRLFEKEKEFRVIPMPTYKTKLKGISKKIFYPFIFLKSIISALNSLRNITSSEKIDKIHITSLYKIFIIRELIVIKYAKKKNIKVIFDIRAGRFIDYYNNQYLGRVCKKCLELSDQILVEGEKYKKFLEVEGYKTRYFPNCLLATSDYKNNEKNKVESNKYKFVFLGRVVEEKGIEDSISILGELQEKYNIEIEFDVIGPIEDSYKKYLKENYKYKFINYLGHMDIYNINNRLQESDFCMFLSKWRGEGHSNAINEIMVQGVPIFFYDNGFLKDVIDNDEFLLDEKLGVKNAEIIYKIINNYEKITLERLRIKGRVNDKFSEDMMKKILEEEYDK